MGSLAERECTVIRPDLFLVNPFAQTQTGEEDDMMTRSKTTALGMVVATSLAMGSMVAANEQGGKEGRLIIPPTLPGIWAAVHMHQGELNQVITAGKLDDVHHHAFAIRDLVAAMPKKSKGLSKEALGKLKAEVKGMRKLAAELDAAGDAGDAAKTKGLAADLDGALKRIEGLYPTGALTASDAKGAAVMYTCSMHPEVMSDKPGPCPKCGMNLVVKK